MKIENLEKACEIADRRLGKLIAYLESTDERQVDEKDYDHLDTLIHTIKGATTSLAMKGYGSSERGRDSMGRYTSRADGQYEGREMGQRQGESMRGFYPMGYGYDDGMGRSMHGDSREVLDRLARETGDEKVRRALYEAMGKM